MATPKNEYDRQTLSAKTAYAREEGGGFFWFFGKCTTGNLFYFFTNEDEAVRLYHTNLPRFILDDDDTHEWDCEEEENMVEDVFCDELQTLLGSVFDILESKGNPNGWTCGDYDGYYTSDIKELREKFCPKSETE